MREGENNKTIAEALFVTEATVKAHITAIFRKLNVSNRTQAVLVSDYINLT
jgi:DNA-binding NarL/FixJ family response regulator